MEYQIAVYSTDTVFARMLELEFQMRGMSVLTSPSPDAGHSAEVVLLDLDTSRAPDSSLYRRMIGFTRGSAVSTDEAHRSCTMIFHRPFEMRLLRREVLDEREAPRISQTTAPLPLSLNAEQACLVVGSRRLSLSPKELLVMQCLLENRGKPVSRESIAAVIGESSANKTDVYICFLRRKLENFFGDRIIKTDRKKGYRIP